jgi:hypothetical protein
MRRHGRVGTKDTSRGSRIKYHVYTGRTTQASTVSERYLLVTGPGITRNQAENPHRLREINEFVKLGVFTYSDNAYIQTTPTYGGHVSLCEASHLLICRVPVPQLRLGL